MKYLLTFCSIIVSVLFFALFLLFTQTGNNILQPHLENYIQKKLQKDVLIEAFTLKTSFIDLVFTVDKNSKLTLNGKIDILKKEFDLIYIVDAKNLITPFAVIDGILHVEGSAKGEIQNFQLAGAGEAFKSNITFLAHIEKQQLKDIQIDAKGVKIEDVLTFAKKPIYSRGAMDISANIVSKGLGNYQGDGSINILHATLDNSLIKKDFGLELNQTVTYKGTVKAHMDGQKIYAKIDILSNIAQIKTTNSEYDLKKQLFYSDYAIHIPKLGMLKDSLQGSIELDGKIQKTPDDFSLDVNSKTLGGTIEAIVFNNTLKLKVQEIELAKLSQMLKQPKYSDGKLTLFLDMKDTRAKSRDANLTLHVKDGNLHVNKLIQTKRADEIKYELSLKSAIKQNYISIDSHISSDVLELNISQSSYNLDNNTIQGEYVLKVADLNNLYFITSRPLRGDMQVIGNYRYDKMLYIDGSSNLLDAKTTFSLQDNLLHLKSSELSIAKVTNMLYYPKLFDAYSMLEVDYNLTSQTGSINIDAPNGKLLKNQLTEIIYLASGFDLTKELYKDTQFRGMVDKSRVDFSLLMSGLESYLEIYDGNLNLKTNEIDSKFSVKIEHRDFKGSIKGELENPTVRLSGSEYIKQKLNKAIEKNIPQEWQDTAKELLKLFN